ncbi:MAG: hypothetical protein ACJ71Z_05140 [Aeromicrobium sp.]
MKPGRRRLLIPGLLVALLVVVAVAAGVRRAEAKPSAVPPVPATKVSTIDDPRVTESSGLAASMAHPGLAYTVNDSGHAPEVYAIDIASGRVVGVTKVKDVTWRDTEAMALWGGKLWIADAGNNDLSRNDQALYVFDEPGPGNHRVTAVRYPITFQPAVNVEAMTILPGRIDLYYKGWPNSGDFVLPGALSTTQPNVARRTGRLGPAFTTDASLSADGKYVLIRSPVVVEVHDARTWAVVHRDAVPVLAAGETIAMESSGRSYLIGSEGSNSPLLRVAFDPATFGGPVPDVELETQMRSQHPVQWFLYEHRRVLGGVGAATVAGLVAAVVALRRARRRRRHF